MSENKSLSNTDSKGWSQLEILLRVLFSAFSLICIWLFWSDVVWPLFKIIDAEDWNETSCVVISSQLNTQSGRTTTYSVDIVYSYEIQGQTYQSNRYSFTDLSSLNEATAIVDRYPPGTRTSCYVNPRDPTDAVIEHQGGLYQVFESRPVSVILFISFIFLLFGAGGLSSLIVRFIVRFIERRNLTKTRLIYWVVKIVNFSVFVGRLAVLAFFISIFIIPPLILPVKEYGFIAVLWILIIGLIVAGIGYLIHLVARIGYLIHLPEEAKGSPWQKLAASNHLKFVPVKFLGLRSYPSIIGNYRHHHLKLETFEKNHGEYRYTCTRLSVSVDKVENDSFSQKGKPLLSEQVSSKNAMRLLTPTSPHYLLQRAKLKGSITARTVDQTVYVCHEHIGIENNSKYLGYLFDLLSDLAEACSPVVTLGGEAVPFLKDMIARHHYESIATELLKDIARRTTKQLGDRTSQLVCPSCLAHYKAHKVLLGSLDLDLDYIIYYGCHICGQSREFLEGRLVAVLDSRMDTERVQQNGTLRVNWLVHRTLFDFDEVEIVRATDEDVERFAVQVGNDTDDFRRPRYREMPCTIVPDCGLSENTLRILKNTFDVEFRSTAQKQETFPNRSLESMIIPPPIQPEMRIRPSIRLRSEPLMVATDECRDLFKLDDNRRPREYIRNDFEDRGEVVMDQATGLIWQKSGSNEALTYEQARTYIQQRHDERFAGHDNWRLPTIEELMSLLEPEKPTNGLYIKPIFDRRQPGCWSADIRSPESAWRMRFGYGDVHWHCLTASDYVRGVCFWEFNG